MLFVGDDWAEAHHDIEIQDASGRVLVRRRLPEGPAGMVRLHEPIADHAEHVSDQAGHVLAAQVL